MHDNLAKLQQGINLLTNRRIQTQCFTLPGSTSVRPAPLRLEAAQERWCARAVRADSRRHARQHTCAHCEYWGRGFRD